MGLALFAVLAVACSSPPPVSAPSLSATPTPSPTKPSSTQQDLAAPSYVRWAVDKSGDAARPYFLDLIYDGVATNFRILDGAGQVILRVPIAGSGVFGAETCAVRARQTGKTEVFTYVVIDAPTLERFVANASSYRVEADSVGGRTVTVPLTDSGCRAS